MASHKEIAAIKSYIVNAPKSKFDTDAAAVADARRPLRSAAVRADRSVVDRDARADPYGRAARRIGAARGRPADRREGHVPCRSLK